MPIRLSFEKTVCGIALLTLRYCTPSNCGIALSEVKEMLKKHISRQDLRYWIKSIKKNMSLRYCAPSKFIVFAVLRSFNMRYCTLVFCGIALLQKLP